MGNAEYGAAKASYTRRHFPICLSCPNFSNEDLPGGTIWKTVTIPA
ncbi:hypothetical protein B4135_1117 [Caldibacillus debilis]|uniref:Uncharacterized protein n=1 Tax=Caldibacillus debilis TaxID=301148 RepID=A0A150MDJ8_9BACI|nr:hypothetical protein B4135_1117 [Caldibacillus debilis]